LGSTDAVRAQCCAQFVVSRERILRHSRDEYVALRQWILEGSKSDLVSGRILSYIWHILFIKPGDLQGSSSESAAQSGIDLEQLNSRACPRAQECYCRLYGRCNLARCVDGSCYGQYQLPPDLKLPTGWADTHG
jgi:hypothetical protein